MSPAGWCMVVAAGTLLGVGLTRQTDLRWYFAIPTGIVVLWSALWLLDRRAWRRALTVIVVDNSVSEVEQLVQRLRARGLPVAIGREPLGVACRGRIHDKVVAAIRDDAVGRAGRQ